jgi:hypothetical protein
MEEIRLNPEHPDVNPPHETLEVTKMRFAARISRLEGIPVTRPLTHKEARQLAGWKSMLAAMDAEE